MSEIKVLVAENDPAYRESLVKDVLEPEGYTVYQAESIEEAKKILKDELIHLAIIDIRLENDDDPNDKSGLKFAEEIDPIIAKIVLTAYPPGGILAGAFPSKTWLGIDDSKDRFMEVYLANKADAPTYLLKKVKKALNEEFEIFPRDRIAVITSGGDSPGMNAAIWSIVRIAMDNHIEVIGVEDGFRGLVKGEMKKLTWRSIRNIMGRSGTILGTARYKQFEDPDNRKKAMDNIIRKRISGIVVIGGDGSMNGVRVLAEDLKNEGIHLQTVGLPGTIDNDLFGTDISLGADSAANAMIEQMRNLLRPAQALRRIFVCEAMGRYSGYLTLEAALGAGADAVIIPEQVVEITSSGSGAWIKNVNINSTEENLNRRLKEIARLLEQTYTAGKRSGFVVVSEGVRLLIDKDQNLVKKIKNFLEDEISRWSLPDKPDVRTFDLGHPVRGVPPYRLDVWLGSRLGAAAIESLIIGETNKMVGWSEENGIIKTLFDVVVRESNREPREIWRDRTKWQELLELQEATACPPSLIEELRTRGNRFVL